MTLPNASGSYPVAPKVKWGAIGSYLAGLVMTALLAGFTSGNLIAVFPDWLTPFILALVPAAASWVAGYNAKHQYRAGEVAAQPPLSELG